MSFILKNLNVNVKSKSLKNPKESKTFQADLADIEFLKKQLVNVGFAPDEVNFMVRQSMTHKKKSLIDMSISEINKVKKALTDQLEIANKCLNVIKEQ